MLKNFITAAIVAVPLVVFCSTSYASGLSTTFSEVTLQDLETGNTYSTKNAINLPLAVVNTGKGPVDLKIETLLPAAAELKDGFEPIPDLSWIKLEKSEFKDVKPNEAAVTDVAISIPGNQKYAGKKYQIFIWSHTVGRDIGVGLKSKLLLSIKG